MSPFDTARIDPVKLRTLGDEMAKAIASETSAIKDQWLATMAPGYGSTFAPSLTEADVRRIVREELDARFPAPSVLDVTPEDVRAWLPGGLCR